MGSFRKRDDDEVVGSFPGLEPKVDWGKEVRHVARGIRLVGALGAGRVDCAELRAGEFPALIDRGRTVHRYRSFAGVTDARDWLVSIYRRDRTEGQQWSVYLGVEKAGIVEQLEAWFGDLGVPILALGGYGSETYAADVAADVGASGRPAVLLYAGDFDPSGEDIDRDFVARTRCWAHVERVALTADLVTRYALPPQPGKERDTRAAAFVARHGALVQVELDALAPEDLRALFDEALAARWDDGAYRRAIEREETERAALAVA